MPSLLRAPGAAYTVGKVTHQARARMHDDGALKATASDVRRRMECLEADRFGLLNCLSITDVITKCFSFFSFIKN
jgi:hypothetical protein